MASIAEINAGSSYTGSAQLGGKLDVGVTLDPSPLARLATFTFYRDRDMWEKKQRDNKLVADKIAMLSAFDINSPLKPYSDDLKSRSDKIKEYIKKRPTALNYDKDKEGYQEVYSMIGDFENARKHATANDTLYNAEKARVERLPAGTARDAGMALLDMNVTDLFKDGVSGAYSKQIRTSPVLKPDDYKLPTIPDTEVFKITRNANDTVIEGKAYADIDRLDNLADGTYFNLTEGRVNTESDEFKKLSESEQNRQKLEATVSDKKVIALDSTAKTINELVQSFRSTQVDAQGNPLSIENIPESEIIKAGGSVANYIKSVKGYNKQIDELNAATGKTYSHINLDDGATPQELLKLEFFNNHGGTLFKELKPTVQQTDNELQRRGQDLDYQAALARASKETKPPDAIENPARIFGTHIDRVKNYYSTHNPKTDRLTVAYSALDDDTRKALGIPVKVDDTDYDDKYVVYNPDGSYRLGTDRKGKGGTPGTLEQIRKGFIDVVKTGMDEKGVQSEGFQTNAENGFYKIFGVNNAQMIWDGWNTGGATQSPTPNQGSTKSSSSSGGGYSDVTPATYKGKKITVGIKDGKWYNTQTGEEIK